jgi:DNA-binding MarR family transcriptional regulator
MTEQTTASTPENVGLLASLMQSAKLAEARAHAALDAVGISIPKFQALHHLVEAGGSLSLGQLAERQTCVKSNVTTLVDRLAADGLVRRVPDPQDRRSIVAEITALGRRRYLAGQAAMTAMEDAFVDSFTAAEREQLARLLSRQIR